MVVSLILLFFTCLALSFFEERLTRRDKIIFYVVLGIAMILIAGLRAVDSTPDSDIYELMYYGKDNRIVAGTTEPSFVFICSVLNSLSLGVNALFFTYAIISISIHLPFFFKFSKIPFVTLTIYISYYYMMHDMVQIRAGVAAGFFLWAIYFYVEQKNKYALAAILLGVLFHYSAAAGLIIFFVGNSNRLPLWQKSIMYAIIPVGIIFYFSRFDLSSFIPDELGGSQLMAYRKLKDKGIEDDYGGWPLEINILIWMNMVLYCACICYHDYLVKHCKYVTVAIKVQTIGFCCLFFLNGVSKVLGNRLNDFFSVSTIILWTASVYAFYPRLISKIISNLISTVRFVTSMLAYALSLYFM